MAKRITCLFFLRTPKKSARELLNLTGKLNGTSLPIYFRITVDGKRAELSTGETTSSDNWNQARNRLKGNSEKVKTTTRVWIAF
jgi:Arm DNA-binding domain